MSFAPLAARLAARAAGLRAVDGARDTLASFAALVVCALLEMLICMCEALDARAMVEINPTAGQRGNRISLDAPRRSPAYAVLAPFPTTSRARMLRAVDNRATASYVDFRTFETLGSDAIASDAPVPRDPVPLQTVPARLWLPPPQKADFWQAPTHERIVTIS